MKEKARHTEPPFFVPRELLSRRFTCYKCHSENLVDWYYKQRSSLHSVKGTTPAGGYWVRQTFENECGFCGTINQIFPTKWSADGSVLIHSDEAFREYQQQRVFLVAGCAIPKICRQTIETVIDEVEEEVAEASKGRITSFHAKEIMGMKEMSVSWKFEKIQRVADVMRSPKIAKIAVAYITRRPLNQKKMRYEPTSFFMQLGMWVAAKNGLVPHFIFDRDQPAKKSGWIEDCFTGFRRFPIFYELAGGNPIPIPKDDKPLATPQSKMADCISYIICREIFSGLKGVVAEISSSVLGNVHGAYFGDEGDVTYGCIEGYPSQNLIQHFFKNT